MDIRLSLVAILGLSACEPADDAFRVDTLRGKQLFEENCAACHGADARGAGPAAEGLAITPPTLRRLKIDNDGVFPQDYVLGVIDGLERHSSPTAIMPEFGAGDMGPIIQVEDDGFTVPTPAKLLALAAYLESIQD